MRKLCLITALALRAATVLADESLADREIEIYSALINHGLGADVTVVVLASETTGDPAAIAAQDDAAAMVAELGAPPETLTNWLQRNSASFSIDRPLALSVSYQMLSPESRAEIFSDVDPASGWAQFYGRYAGAPGLLRLSRAGFDHSLEHALVYIEYECGIDCGSGRLVHVVFTAGTGWHVLDAAVVWMVE